MKSPWKLIGQLFSDRKASEVSQSRADNDTKPSEAVQEARDAAERPTAAALTSSASPVAAPAIKEDENRHIGERRSGDAVDTVEMGDGAPAFMPDPDLPGEGPEVAVSGLPHAGRGRRPRKYSPKKTAATVRVPAKTTVLSRKRTGLGGTPISFDDQVSRVDAEVRALRLQLSEKLKLQNAQLRQMLERFGGV